jgi:hypothetical protein
MMLFKHLIVCIHDFFHSVWDRLYTLRLHAAVQDDEDQKA